jgi:hypothetical protein
MLDMPSGRQLSETADFTVLWASSDGARCVLATLHGVWELRLEHDGRVLRRGHFVDIRQACDAARQWRIDWDIESRKRDQRLIRILCPECGDDAFGERETGSGAKWFRCASCGEVWTIDGTGEGQGH